MSVTILRAADLPSAAATQPQALAMWRAQPGALMLLGRSGAPMPKTGSTRMGAASGVFRAESWPLAGEAGYAFLAALRLPPGADRADGVELTMRGARSADREFLIRLSSSSGEAEFGRQAGTLAKPHAARLARFMLNVMRSDEGDETRQPCAVLGAFLAHAARPDGCVELIMHVPQRCVVLQGWGLPQSEPVEVLVPQAGTTRHAASSGTFVRADLTAPSTGNILVLPPTLANVMAGLEMVYLLAGDDLVSRPVIQPVVLDADPSVGQIRHLLPRLTCSPPLQALLRATLQPQYSGRDTLNDTGRPVRAALDMAVASSDAGAYVSGWVFDPAARTVELHLCTAEVAARLDESWVRIPRPDVSAAFAADPAFPAPRCHDWGFAVAVPQAFPVGQPAYLRFTFDEGDQAFVPVRLKAPDAPAVLDALFASVDPHKSSGLALIERHLAPFVMGLPVMDRPPHHILLRGPLDRARAIVVPLRAARLPRSFVSSFLLDPATADEQLIFVCGSEWDDAQIEALIGLIRFYQLPASVIGVSETPLPAGSVCDAATASGAGSFLLASPGAVGPHRSWREALHRATAAEPVACPTVLFEDRSVRFAGAKHVTFFERTPFAGVTAPLAGACADVAGEGEPIRSDMGTLACCLIHRAALPALSHAARFRTEAGQEAAFFLSLREAGLGCLWAPDIRVSAPEEEAGEATPVVQLVDGWILRQAWGKSPSCAS